ncbi:MAG TPA: lycopene cyclase family protein, partial [Polyangiaceae bacterium]
MHAESYDYIVVGGGLHGALIALALLEYRPTARLALVERAATLGGNHVWCFHAGDVPERVAAIVAPMVERAWPS